MVNFINPQLHKQQLHGFGGQHGQGIHNHGKAAHFGRAIAHGNTKQLVNQTLNMTVQISNFVNKQSVQVGFEPVRHACHHCNHVVGQVGQHGGGYGNQGGQINNLLNQVFQLLTQLLGALGGGDAYGGGNAYGGGQAYGGGNAYGGGQAYGGGNAYGGGHAYGGGNAYGGGQAYGGGNAYGGGYTHGLTGRTQAIVGGYTNQVNTVLKQLTGLLQGFTKQPAGGAYGPQPQIQPVPYGGGHNQPAKNITVKWLAQHGGYKKNADGSYNITKGTYAGHVAVHTGGGKFAVYKDHCLIGHWDSSAKKDKIASPIALDMNGDGKISTTGNSTAKERVDNHVGDTIAFDIDGDGAKENIEWIAGDDALLVDTTKIGANGEINGEALFGDQGGKYADGYVKLGNLDANADGQLTDGELKNLSVWTDNGNGVVDAGEVKSLKDAGIVQLSTQKQDVQNERGETLMRSTANNGKVVTEDVWFRKA